MDSLERRQKLIDEFKKKKKEQNCCAKKIVPFKDLNINFEKETFQWQREMNGGAKCE